MDGPFPRRSVVGEDCAEMCWVKDWGPASVYGLRRDSGAEGWCCFIYGFMVGNCQLSEG